MKTKESTVLITPELVKLIRSGCIDGDLNSFEEQIFEVVRDENGRINQTRFVQILKTNPIVRTAWEYAVQLVDGVTYNPPSNTIIPLPDDQYVSDVLPYILPQHSLLIAPTGRGKSYAMTQLKGTVVIACSSVTSAAQLEKVGAAVWHEGKYEIGRVTATTYESLPSVCKKLIKNGIHLEDVTLVIDEIHNIASAQFRSSSIKKLVEQSANFGRVIAMTGTPVTLPEPFSDYFTVVIQANLRDQPATAVKWQKVETDENGKERKVGKRSLTGATLAVDVVENDGRCIVFYNNKREGLSRLISDLVALGIEQDAIKTFNSDEKKSALGQSIIDSATVPEHIKVLIVTSVATESINIRGKFDAIIAISPLHPALHQQLANRLRDEAAHYYMLANGKGKGYQKYEIEEQIANLTETAQMIADGYNASEANGKKLRNADGHSIIRNKDGKWQADALAITMQAFSDQRTYYLNNPDAMNAYLKGNHNWKFGKEKVLVIGKLPDDKKDVSDNLQKELDSKRQENYERVLDHLQNSGAISVENELLTGGIVDPVLRKAVDRIQTIDKNLGELNGGQNEKTWERACEIVRDNGDSSGSHRRTTHALYLEKLRQNQDELVINLFNSFEVGKSYTQEERRTLFEACYQSSGYGILLNKHTRHYWSEEKECLLTDKRIEQIFNAMFVSNKVRVRENGQRLSKKTIVATHFSQLITDQTKMGGQKVEK